MSRKCQISGKGPMSGNTRSHALNSSRRKWNVNLQKATILVDGKPTTVRISARELRTLRNQLNNINSTAVLFFILSNYSYSMIGFFFFFFIKFTLFSYSMKLY